MITVGATRKVPLALLIALLVPIVLSGPWALWRTYSTARAAETIGATGDNAAGWVINTGTGHLVSPSKKITGLADGTASGEAVNFGQTATTSTSGLLTATDKQWFSGGSALAARVVTTSALMAYTYANGSSGVGATITASSNGACPAASFDGITLAVGDAVLVQNGASFADNGLYTVTAPLGDGSNPCKLTRHAGSDSQAEIVGSIIRVNEGLQSTGAVYRYTNSPSITMGTTALAWLRIDGGRTANEYQEYWSDFDYQVADPATGTAMPGPFGGTFSIGASCDINVVASTATERGVLEMGTGTGTTCGSTISLAAATPPISWDTDAYIEGDSRFTGPNVVSDGTNTFRMLVGLASTTGVAGTDGVWLENTQTVDATHWLFTTRTSSTSTSTAGPVITFSNATYIRYHFWKYAGETTVHASVDGTEIGSGQSTNVPTGVLLTPDITIVKSAGATARKFNIDWYKLIVAKPKRRAA